MIEVKKVKRNKAEAWIFSIEVAKKTFVCAQSYKSERSCATAAANFVKRYIKE